ncbi:MAG: hypothetical protein ACI4E1_10210 [Lachnospira sp.]
MNIKFSINKKSIFKEVETETGYVAVKGSIEKDLTQIVSVVEEDYKHLETFFNDARIDLVNELAEFVNTESEEGDDYSITLSLSNSFNQSFVPTINISLFRYFVQYLLSKWWIYTNKQDSGAYADSAVKYLQDIHKKALFKVKPHRPH